VRPFRQQLIPDTEAVVSGARDEDWVFRASEPARTLMRYSSAMDEPDVNTGKKWSGTDLCDLRFSIEKGLTVAEIACLLGRTESEVREKAVEELRIELE
jgi:hypothetical protein